MTIRAAPDSRDSHLDPDKHLTTPTDARLGYSIEEFAERVGIGRTLAYQAALRGEIPTRRIGRRLIVPKTALDAWLVGGDAAWLDRQPCEFGHAEAPPCLHQGGRVGAARS